MLKNIMELSSTDIRCISTGIRFSSAEALWDCKKQCTDGICRYNSGGLSKSKLFYQGETDKNNKNDINNNLGICPECGKYSLQFNSEKGVSICINQECNHIIAAQPTNESRISMVDKGPASNQEKNIPESNNSLKSSNYPSILMQIGRKWQINKPDIQLPVWGLSIILIFVCVIVGVGISALVKTSIPLWLLFILSIIFSIEKWFQLFIQEYKSIGKVYKLCQNLAVLYSFGIIIWSLVKLFSSDFTGSPVIGSLVVIGEIVVFLWFCKIVIDNDRRWPSMKLTILCLIVLFIIFSFAGVSPFVEMKNNIFKTVNLVFN